jgi:DNA-binding beta-propeller fold protein YncE
VVAADTYANRVESWNADGSSNWQDSTANGTPFNHPYDAAVANGIVYVADSGNKRIVELNASTGAYAGTISGPQLHSPYGVAVDPVSGSVWVSDTSYNRVLEFSSTGAYIQAFGKAGSAAGQFNRPTHLDVHVDAGGTAYLYVVDTYNDRIQILDLNEN